MLILTLEEFNNKFTIDNSATSDIRIKDIGKDISLTPIEIVMRDQSPKIIREPASQIYEPKFNIIVNLHPTDGTHWVSVIRREVGPVYYFVSFVVETPLLFLDEYVDLGSNERIQQYDESYCGDYCLYMIYLIDRGFRIKSALNILVNQCKYPGIYNECFCLGCNVNQGTDSVRGMPTCFADVNDNDNVNDKDNVNDNDNQGTCFADDNDKDNDNDSVNDTVNDKDKDNVNFDHDNVNDNVNDNNNDKDMIMLMIMLMIIIMIRTLIMIMLMLRIMIMLMMMLMIRTRTMIMLMIMLISEPASQMIFLYIREPAWLAASKARSQIYLMKNIKRVNLKIIPLLVISLLI